MLSDLILSSHLLSTAFMTGLIWFVQIVHYPLFASVGREEFAGYERRHQVLTTWVVGPVMCLELVTGIVWLLSSTAGVRFWHLSNCTLLAMIWLSTALLQVPAHRALAEGWSKGVHRRLVGTNWIRTVAWTIRSLIVTWLTIA